MRAALTLVLTLAACGGEDTALSTTGSGGGGAGGGTTSGCPPGELATSDGECRPAGLPADWQEPGPTTEPTGGVPQEACGEGFTPDGDLGCEPVLPATPCPDGLMAVPGDTSCRPVAECGSGTWGDIPVTAATLYVDPSFAGVPDGSATNPYPTIQAAVDAAAPGAIVAVAAGTYVEDVVVDDHPVVIWGRCPGLVEVQGVADLQTIRIAGVTGAAVRGLSVTGPSSAIGVVGAPGTLLSQLWIHDTGAPGVFVEEPGPETLLEHSLIERATFTGVIADGSTLGIEASEIRHSEVVASTGRAIDALTMATVRVEGSNIHDSTRVGIYVEASALELRRTVVSDTSANGTNTGFAIYALDAADEPSTVALTQSVFLRNTEASLTLLGSELTAEAITIDEGLASADGFNRGLWLYDGINPTIPSRAIVRDSTIRNQPQFGVEVVASELEAEGLLVAGISPAPLSGAWGDGIHLRRSDDLLRSSDVTLVGCVVEDTRSAGVNVHGSTLAMTESVVRDVDVGGLAEGAAGVAAIWEGGGMADVLVDASRIEGVVGFGALAGSSRLSLDSVLITDIDELAVASETGNGVVAYEREGESPADVAITSSRVTRTQGFGIVSVASQLTMTHTLLDDVARRGMVIERSTADLSWSEVRRAVGIGMLAVSSHVTAEGLAVEEISAALLGQGSSGVTVADLGSGPASLSLLGARIERVAAVGVVGSNANLTIEATSVRDVTPDGDGAFGRGVIAQEGTTLGMAGSSVEGTHEVGIHVIGSEATIEGVRIASVLPALNDGLFGDGLILSLGSAGTFADSQIRDVARAAVAVFDASLSLAGNDLRCNDLPINLEDTGTLEDLGGNNCGCDQEAPCKAQSASLMPPEALPDPE